MDADFSMFQTMLSDEKREIGVVAKFYDRPIKTGNLTEKGLPEFKLLTYVEIRVRDNNDIFDGKATESHIRRFPIEYNRYLLEKKQTVEGTPLNQFAFLTIQQLEDCKYRGIFTVETLASLDDDKAKQLSLIDERELAKKFLDVSKNNKIIADFEKKERKYKEEIKKLKEELSLLKAKENE